MYYTKAMNRYITSSYNDISHITKKIENFFNHISSLSTDLKLMIDSESYELKNCDIENYYTKLKKLIFKPPTLSIIILCKNESRCIKRCIDSIYSEIATADELIVVDTGSTDDSLDIVSHYSSIKLFHTPWEDDFAKVRNYALTCANNDWIFFIDADESLSSSSLHILKEYLSIIDWMGLQSIVVAPTIINSDSSVARGVRRILRNNSRFHYTGKVHEELRLDDCNLGTDVKYISFDNIILNHDGYDPDIVSKKNKVPLYINGLKYMVKEEPTHPRWLYFLCRDGEKLLSGSEYEKKLLLVVELSSSFDEFHFYKVRALSDLIRYYISCNSLNLAEKYLNILKNISPTLSDILYFSTILNLNKIKSETAELLNSLIQYRASRTTIDYGSMHSNYFHIDSLLALLFFEIGEYEKAFTLFKKLEKSNVGNYKSKYMPLYEALNQFMFSK